MGLGVPEIAIILGILCLCLLVVIGLGALIFFLVKKS